MRIGASAEETRKLWSALPALAASAPLGGPRPGATVLAVTTAPGGGVFPVVAVQRYGQGRSMVFAGEASWRWKMMVASSDRTYEFFWRQAARWLASTAPDPVAISAAGCAGAGRRDRRSTSRRATPSFAPVADADGRRHADRAGRRDARRSSCGTPIRPAAATRRRSRPDQPGLYRIHAEARRGTTPLGAADRWMYVGGVGSRVRRSAAQRRVPAAHRAQLRRPLRPRRRGVARAGVARGDASPQNAAPERRDLWHEPWAFALVVALLSAEWILRRRWGLR